MPASAKADVIVQFVMPLQTPILHAGSPGSEAEDEVQKHSCGPFQHNGKLPCGTSHQIRESHTFPRIDLFPALLNSLNPLSAPTLPSIMAGRAAGIGVAVIDSGIAADHPDLRYRVVYSQNFVAGESRVDDPYGHGTHVAGIVGGTALPQPAQATPKHSEGSLPRRSIVNLRVLDASGHGVDSAVIQAIDRAIELKATYNIRVLNLSLGRSIGESYTQDPLCQAVERAWKAGIVVVVAAGNNGRDNSMGTKGYATITSPGNSPYVITVAP